VARGDTSYRPVRVISITTASVALRPRIPLAFTAGNTPKSSTATCGNLATCALAGFAGSVIINKGSRSVVTSIRLMRFPQLLPYTQVLKRLSSVVIRSFSAHRAANHSLWILVSRILYV